MIRNSIQALLPQITSWRRALHKIPEPGHKEVKTKAYLMEQIRLMGLSYDEIGQTGLIVTLGEKGKMGHMFRCDMDGLSIEEKTRHDFTSVHGGMMHACGHDGHMATALGLLSILKDLPRKESFYVLFQPAEEGPGGAKPLIESGLFSRYPAKSIIGYHLHPQIPSGKMVVQSGPFMAQTGEFYVDIRGKEAHGAMPQDGLDAGLALAQLVLSFQTIISRNLDPMTPGVISVGTLSAGSRQNIIAGEAKAHGTIRAFSQESYDLLKDRMVQVARGIGEATGCQIELSFTDMYPAVMNDEKLTKAFQEALPANVVMEMKPQMIAEDFSYYQQEVAGLFCFVGIKKKEDQASLHSPYFNFKEEDLLLGIEAYIRYLEREEVL